MHLLCEGKQELVSGSIPAGGCPYDIISFLQLHYLILIHSHSTCYSFLNVTDKEYTVGIHADVGENTDIKVFVYDGKDTESYTR